MRDCRRGRQTKGRRGRVRASILGVRGWIWQGDSELISSMVVYSKSGLGHRGRGVKIKTGGQIMRTDLTSEGSWMDFSNIIKQLRAEVAFQSQRAAGLRQITRLSKFSGLENIKILIPCGKTISCTINLSHRKVWKPTENVLFCESYFLYYIHQLCYGKRKEVLYWCRLPPIWSNVVLHSWPINEVVIYFGGAALRLLTLFPILLLVLFMWPSAAFLLLSSCLGLQHWICLPVWLLSCRSL